VPAVAHMWCRASDERIAVTDELEFMWKEALTACFMSLY
jgi:hypothetical protein